MPCNAGYGWCKDKEVVHKDGDMEYCVFPDHADNKSIEVTAFNTLVIDKIDKAIADNRKCDLSGTVFPGDISFQQVNKRKLPEISFESAQFTGEANFESAHFGGESHFNFAHFGGKANFERAVCGGGVDFGSSLFNDSAIFIKAQFSSDADFGGCQFFGVSDFNRAQFNREPSFMETLFAAVSFFGAEFADGAYFRLAQFHNNADFGLAHFAGEVNFREAKFHKIAEFTSASFRKAEFYGPTFEDGVTFDTVSIKESIRFQNVNLRTISFLRTDIRHCEFITCMWHQENGRYILYDETDYKNAYEGKGLSKYLLHLWKHFSKLKEQRISDVKDIEDLYRALKQKSREKFDEYQYSFWHMSEKEMQRERTTIRSSPRDWLVLFIYKYSSGYGEEPGRAFILLGTFIALSFFLIPIASVEISHGWDSARITIDYLTFRKPDEFVPKGFIGFLVSFISHIVIPLQAALFAFALRNRFRR